jgi:hypothetical protein
MNSVFSSIITPQSLIFTDEAGKMHTVTQAHVNYEALRDTLKAAMAARTAGDADTFADLHRTLTKLTEPARLIEEKGQGKVTVRDGTVFYAGEPVHNAVAERILWGLSEGYDMSSYVAFLDNLMRNPSRRAVTELYGFLEANRMGITEDGHIIAYKRVRDDFRDIHSGRFDNSPGQILEMARNAVDDDKKRTCSYGFHFCAMSYLPHFGAGPGNRIVLVKVNPADVVSIPADYANAKARCCRYEVVGEYTGSDKEDLLATKAVWSDDDWSEDEWKDEEANEWENDNDRFDDAEDEADALPFAPVVPPPPPLTNETISRKAPHVILAGQDLVSVHYTRHAGLDHPIAELTWSSGAKSYARTQVMIDLINEQLIHQASLGKLARVTLANSPR